MPIYTYTCTECRDSRDYMRAYEDRSAVFCKTCGGVTERQPSTPRVVNFQAGWYEHVGPTPVYCETPQQLQDACNKHGGQSVYLENSSFKVRRDYNEYGENFEREVQERKARDRNIESD